MVANAYADPGHNGCRVGKKLTAVMAPMESTPNPRLTFGGPTGLPEMFKLLFVSGHCMRDVRTVWQKGLSAGLEFVGPEYAPPARKF